MGDAEREADRPGKRETFGAEKRKRFLEALGEWCNVKHAAAEAGVRPGVAYKAYRRDPAFADAWMEALRLGYVRLEEKLLAHVIRRFDPDAPPADGPVAADMEWDAGPGRPMSDLRVALALLSRHAASVAGGRIKPVKGWRETTAESTDAVLRRQLDLLKKRREKQRAG